ncbi:P-loop NTPase [Heliobacterium gestii]|uniref:P-loop NTPase n=1 Tax=Heliomicrobium gestii TaxID=2699 RepID=A0A845LG15_HELGE|nr:P-loop NTPase [Heliomicrobium gestii]MBM7868177.1 Mrp family chromosome partitioning ATPase [Heliomicrobium gestii]MZP43375.1 P-loop NTPase [Heliomicrobium gestii]
MACEVVIAVMSGKGGTGKSTVTALLAAGLAKAGLSVGVVDADLVGPAIPALFGLKEPLRLEEGRWIPAVTRRGIAVLSAGLLPDEGMSLLAASPERRRAIIDEWIHCPALGERDVLLIDTPSGIGEAQEAVMDAFAASSGHPYRQRPVTATASAGATNRPAPLRNRFTGAVLVTSLRDLDRHVVRRTAAWLQEKGATIVGVVENGGEIECPHCETLIALSDGDAPWAEGDGVIACFPWSSTLIDFARAGRLEEYHHPLVFEMAINIWESSCKGC